MNLPPHNFDVDLGSSPAVISRNEMGEAMAEERQAVLPSPDDHTGNAFLICI
jgi:hypothetical protein